MPAGKSFPLPSGDDLSRLPHEALPTMYDLPSEEVNEPGVPDEFHIFQPQLLRETFQPSTYAPERVFVATDLNLYYTLRNTSWYKRPDWFAALGVAEFYDDRKLRLSYVIWQEAAPPYLAIDLISPGTEQEDLGRTVRNPAQPPTKWIVYEEILQIPYYVTFNRHTDELNYFQLIQGRYQSIQPPGQRLWLPEAGLGLGLWHGVFHRVERQWLRFYDAAGQWIPTPLEQEHQRAERMAARLSALGIDPDEAP